MKINVNLELFIERFRAFGRGDQFTQAGFEKLFEYLTALEADLGEEFELDVIAICCDYSEDDDGNIVDYNTDEIVA